MGSPLQLTKQIQNYDGNFVLTAVLRKLLLLRRSNFYLKWRLMLGTIIVYLTFWLGILNGKVSGRHPFFSWGSPSSRGWHLRRIDSLEGNGNLLKGGNSLGGLNPSAASRANLVKLMPVSYSNLSATVYIMACDHHLLTNGRHFTKDGVVFQNLCESDGRCNWESHFYIKQLGNQSLFS